MFYYIFNYFFSVYIKQIQEALSCKMDVSVICTGSAYISSEFTHLHDGLIDWYLMPTLAVFISAVSWYLIFRSLF
jgi:hypothetical protein